MDTDPAVAGRIRGRLYANWRQLNSRIVGDDVRSHFELDSLPRPLQWQIGSLVRIGKLFSYKYSAPTELVIHVEKVSVLKGKCVSPQYCKLSPDRDHKNLPAEKSGE